MKKEIIIFKDQKPTKEEICHSIEPSVWITVSTASVLPDEIVSYINRR